MKLLPLILASLSLLFLSACTNNSIEPVEATVTVDFIHLNNNEALELDKIKYVNSVGQNYSIKTVKYFISKVTFYKTNCSDFVSSNIHYVDIRDTETLSLELSEKVPYGTYSGISFVYGLVPEDNVSGSLGLELDRLMEWPVPMGGGYHYMKLEGEYLDNNTANFFNFHAGGLDGEAYEIHLNFLDSPFEIRDNSLKIDLEMEINNWFQNPTDWDFTYWGSGIMGNPDAQATVQKNGADVFSINFSSLTN